MGKSEEFAIESQSLEVLHHLDQFIDEDVCQVVEVWFGVDYFGMDLWL